MVGTEAVDLGLSVKWATFNVGARSAEGYGDYYAWGETETKSDYSWSTYFDSINGSSSNFTKYFNDGGKTVLDPEDDVAHVKWGGNWRMPTDAELTELRTKCTWSDWIEDYNGTGVSGYTVTSKTNGNSIFLPAAGYRDGTSLVSAGCNSFYLSSSLSTDYSEDAWGVYFSWDVFDR